MRKKEGKQTKTQSYVSLRTAYIEANQLICIRTMCALMHGCIFACVCTYESIQFRSFAYKIGSKINRDGLWIDKTRTVNSSNNNSSNTNKHIYRDIDPANPENWFWNNTSTVERFIHSWWQYPTKNQINLPAEFPTENPNALSLSSLQTQTKQSGFFVWCSKSHTHTTLRLTDNCDAKQLNMHTIKTSAAYK